MQNTRWRRRSRTEVAEISGPPIPPPHPLLEALGGLW